MSLFEWFGESRNPGSIGEVQPGAPLPSTGSPLAIYARGLFGVLHLAGGVFLASLAESRVFGFGALAIYLLLAYFVRVRPDYSNVGWLGGVIDHPFRYSDDANRVLAFLQIVLMPGRFAVATVRDMVRLMRGRRVMVFTRTDE